MKLWRWNVVKLVKYLCDDQCGDHYSTSGSYIIIIDGNKPKDDTIIISSPPRGWTRLPRDGEVVSHRDGEVGALTPLARLSPGSGGSTHWARSHWQSDPFPGSTQRLGCGARHSTVRG